MSAGRLLLKGGSLAPVAGPGTAGVAQRMDVAVDDGRIVAVEADLEAGSGWRVLDAGGCWIGPGLVDLHAHLRQPGDEEAETVESGSRAAALGGYTAVVAMPNTTPAIDCASVVRDVQELARAALCEVAVAGAITRDRAGAELAPMAEMAALGVKMFTDDGRGVADPAIMRRALEYGGALGVRLAQHCEDAALAGAGCMHEGAWSARLGVPGVPAEAEELMVQRDVALARLTAGSGSRLHLQHLSTARSIEILRGARAEGLDVTAEVTPHHLSLTDACLEGYDPVYKVNPPLRGDADVAALRQALADGVVDAVATDHAPHQAHTKERPLQDAPPGMLGLETALAVVFDLVGLDPARALSVMSTRPAHIAGLDDTHGGPVVAGRAANLVVFDPGCAWTVDAAAQASRSRNTPFAGRRFRGRVRHTIYRGEPVVIDAQAQR